MTVSPWLKAFLLIPWLAEIISMRLFPPEKPPSPSLGPPHLQEKWLSAVLRAAERLAEARQHLAASLHLYGPGGDAVQMAALGALLLVLSAGLRRALRPAPAPAPELREEAGRP